MSISSRTVLHRVNGIVRACDSLSLKVSFSGKVSSYSWHC